MGIIEILLFVGYPLWLAIQVFKSQKELPVTEPIPERPSDFELLSEDASLYERAVRIEKLWENMRKYGVEDFEARVECRDMMREETLNMVRYILNFGVRKSADYVVENNIVYLDGRRNDD